MSQCQTTVRERARVGAIWVAYVFACPRYNGNMHDKGTAARARVHEEKISLQYTLHRTQRNFHAHHQGPKESEIDTEGALLKAKGNR